MKQRTITILGSTGSIGTQALDIIGQHPDLLKVHALVCDKNIDLLAEQAHTYRPSIVVVNDESKYKDLQKLLKKTDVEVRCGPEAVIDVAGDVNADMVLTAMVGFAGLEPTIRAIENNRIIALANKETLVVAGEMITRLAKEHSTIILPVDSEHSAIYQCLVGEKVQEARRIYLTASGGPFVDFTAEQLSRVTPEQALQHPKWNMGQKVTIDSASLMNKGLEMIEAHHLFGVAPGDIEVLVHRQSIIHSMVGFADGSVKAQLALPDMRIPIAYALTYPRRRSTSVALPSVEEWQRLTFERPRMDAFPCLQLAYDALDAGGTAPCALNAANEVAVQRFLSGEIGFLDIPRIIRDVLDRASTRNAVSLEVLKAMDAEARRLAQAWRPMK